MASVRREQEGITRARGKGQGAHALDGHERNADTDWWLNSHLAHPRISYRYQF